MLWDAGQQRIARESRDRLAERVVAARDAGLEVLVATGRAKPVGTWRQPSYIAVKSEPAPQPVRSPAVRDMALAQLGLMYPGMVRRGDS